MSINVSRLIQVAGGEIAGKVRVQKMVYLLDQLGMNSGLSFDYHHFGPYSAELADSVDEAIAFRILNEDIRFRVSDSVPYSVFHLGPNAETGSAAKLGDLSVKSAKEAIASMNKRSATVLELAATVHWLACVEEYEDWHSELVNRKGVKIQGGRDREAIELLKELGLPPCH